MYDKTMTFSVNDEKEIEMKKTLTAVYDALEQKGYNPVNQIVGYILSEDPTYITTYGSKRFFHFDFLFVIYRKCHGLVIHN